MSHDFENKTFDVHAHEGLPTFLFFYSVYKIKLQKYLVVSELFNI